MDLTPIALTSKPRYPRAVTITLVLATIFLVMLLNHLVVARRSPNGVPPWLSISPDTSQYERMVRGSDADAPFAYRRLVPILASLLPVSPLQALGLVTKVSMLGGYAVLSWILIAVLRVSLGATCLALVATMTSTRSLLMVQNPFIIDGFSFFMMTLMLASFLADKPGCFGLAAVTGILAREDCVFGVIGFFVADGRRRGRVALLIVAAAVAAYLLPRLGHARTPSGFMGIRQLIHASYYAKSYFAFGFVWPLGLLGLWLTRASKLRRLVSYAVWAFAGSVVSTFFAADTTRMFLPLLPLVAVAGSLVFDRLAGQPALMMAWLALFLTNVGLALPNVFTAGATERMRELEDWYGRLVIPIVVHQFSGMVLVALSARAVLAQADDRGSAVRPAEAVPS